MTGCGPLALITLGFALAVGLAAWVIARRVATGDSQNFWFILVAILAALAVLQGGARLPLLTEALYTRWGHDPAVACGGQLRMGTFVAVMVVTAAFVGGFFVSFRGAKRKG